MKILISAKPEHGSKFNIVDSGTGTNVAKFIDDSYSNEESFYSYQHKLVSCSLSSFEDFNRWIFSKASWVNRDWLTEKRLELMQWK